MSSDSQAIFFFIAFLGCILAAFWDYWTPANRSLMGFHPGWAGLASFMFVAFWTAVKSS